jgi:hypothetical protein
MKDQNLQSSSDDSHLQIKFNSQDVFLVMGSDGSDTSIGLTLNGQKLGIYEGQDVDNNSYVLVNEYRLYHLVSSQDFITDGILDLKVPSGVKLFAFTFGS